MKAKHPVIDGSIVDWLKAQVVANAQLFKEKSVILDVGAYHGDFSRELLNIPDKIFSEAVLFEPNPDSVKWLAENFANDKRVRVEQSACANEPGEAKLFCQGASYTGSILPYEVDISDRRSEVAVCVTTVDRFVASNKLENRIGFIKVDTQGNDLRVLQGAVNTLKTSRPWLVVEMIRVPQYVNQAKPAEMIAWLEGQGYFLAAQFNEVYTNTGWLGWFDACFVPEECFSMQVNAQIQRPTAASIKNSIPKRFLKRVRWAMKQSRG